jgi:uncharacterized protein
MRKISEELLGKGLDRLLRKAEGDTSVCAVILFGSVAKGVSTSLSDIDVCLVLNETLDSLPMSLKKLEYLSLADYDVSIFQQLPLYIRRRVIEEGDVLLCSGEDRLYELVFKTIKEFGDFKPIYDRYLEGVLHA